MAKNLFVGKPVLFSIDNSPADLGEIIEITENENRLIFKVRRPSHKTSDGWEYFNISEDQILKINQEPPKPAWDPWAIEHKTEINEAFGRDLDAYFCVIAYDNLDDMINDGFEDCIQNERFCRRVSDKWVLIVA